MPEPPDFDQMAEIVAEQLRLVPRSPRWRARLMPETPDFDQIAMTREPVPFGYVRCSCGTDIRLPAHEPVAPADPSLPPGIDLAFGTLESIRCPTCGADVPVPADQAWIRPHARASRE